MGPAELRGGPQWSAVAASRAWMKGLDSTFWMANASRRSGLLLGSSRCAAGSRATRGAVLGASALSLVGVHHVHLAVADEDDLPPIATRPGKNAGHWRSPALRHHSGHVSESLVVPAPSRGTVLPHDCPASLPSIDVTVFDFLLTIVTLASVAGTAGLAAACLGTRTAPSYLLLTYSLVW